MGVLRFECFNFTILQFKKYFLEKKFQNCNFSHQSDNLKQTSKQKKNDRISWNLSKVT